MTSQKQPLSLSIQTFEDLVVENRIYVDKTEVLHELIASELKACFFSRPRRFGKSLTVSTLDAIFSGKKHLFENLTISKTDYTWPIHPVIRLDMKYAAEATYSEAEKGLEATLKGIANQYGLLLDSVTVATLFERLIHSLYQKTGQKVVVLIDEYDKPLIDNLDNMVETRKIQGLLKRFYGVLKSADEYLRFVFITGVSKFSKVSVFSDLNHLTDLTMDSRFATLVGMTEDELITNYTPHIDTIATHKGWSRDQVMAEIRRWYNGYRFSKNPIKVYNPWSTLSLFSSNDFQEHWYSTGIPKFLIDMINRDKKTFSALNPADFEWLPDYEMSKIATYDIETLALLPMLLQTGFLTIKDFHERRNTYSLGYPNWEVRKAFSAMVLDSRIPLPNGQSTRTMAMDIRDAIEDHHLERLILHINRLLASIPGNLHTPKESYYHSLIHMIFQTSGLTIRSEEWVSGGRIDTVIEEPDRIYIIEFKFDGAAADAIAQIQTRGYAEKYRDKPVYALGIGVSCATKSIADWELVPLG